MLDEIRNFYHPNFFRVWLLHDSIYWSLQLVSFKRILIAS